MKALLISKAFFIKVVEVANPLDEICVDKRSGKADVEYSSLNVKEENKIHFKMNEKLNDSIRQLESIIENITVPSYLAALRQVVDRLKSIESDKTDVDVWAVIWDRLKKAEREEFKNDNLKK